MLMFPKFYPTVADAGQRSWSWLTQNGADGRIDRVLQCSRGYYVLGTNRLSLVNRLLA